jgi:phenylacetate-CoA ligase
MLNIRGLQIHRRRYNSNFYNFLNQFQKSDSNNVNADQLRLFLKHASKTPYWGSVFKRYQVEFGSSRNLLSEIKKLPVITKSDVLKNYSNIVSKIQEKSFFVNTSGTSGQRLKFPLTVSMENKQWAIWWRYRLMHNIRLHEWCGLFGGTVVVPPNQSKPPFWRNNFFNKQIMFSPIHLNIENTVHYYNAIKIRKLTWLHGYPSQILNLASNILELGLPPISSIKIITTGSESLLKHQKVIIKKAFSCPIFNHYGLTEGSSNISQFPDGSYYPDQDFALTEFVPYDEKNNIYKIIGTNYSNLAFPLIRYDTGDLVELEKRDGSKNILSILGRVDDYVTLSNGNRFGPMNLLFKEFKNIKEAQLYYPKTNELVFRIVKDSNFNTKTDEANILNSINKRITDKNSRVKIVYLNNLKRSKMGKIKSVVTK